MQIWPMHVIWPSQKYCGSSVVIQQTAFVFSYELCFVQPSSTTGFVLPPRMRIMVSPLSTRHFVLMAAIKLMQVNVSSVIVRVRFKNLTYLLNCILIKVAESVI